jgi:hypothetical protein
VKKIAFLVAGLVFVSSAARSVDAAPDLATAARDYVKNTVFGSSNVKCESKPRVDHQGIYFECQDSTGSDGAFQVNPDASSPVADVGHDAFGRSWLKTRVITLEYSEKEKKFTVFSVGSWGFVLHWGS